MTIRPKVEQGAIKRSPAKLGVALNYTYSQIDAVLAGGLAQGLGGRARDVNCIRPISLPGMASFWAAAADDCAEPK